MADSNCTPEVNQEQKHCYKCGEGRPLSRFAPRWRQCKDCSNAAIRLRMKKRADPAYKPQTIHCPTCGNDWPSERFSAGSYRCKDCCNAAARLHRSVRKEWYKQWHIDHVEERRAKDRNYYAKNKEKKAAYREANRQHIRAHYKQFYEENKTEILRLNAVRRKANPEKTAAYCAKHRALKQANEITSDADVIAKFYAWVKDSKTVRCYWCNSKIPKGVRQVDHIVPLSKGGVHGMLNLCASCQRCNRSKGARSPEEFRSQCQLPFLSVKD